MVGLAVHRAVQAAQLGVLFVALNERIVDVQVRGRVRLLRLGLGLGSVRVRVSIRLGCWP